jgi:Fur family zinc uptake transcriptional regulator
MICRKCDSVSEEEALTRDFSVSQIGSKAGFTVEKAVIEAKGLCHSCAELA